MQGKISLGERMFRNVACHRIVSKRRVQSIIKLTAFPSEKTKETLLDVLWDVDPNVQQAAIDSILQIGDNNIIKRLLLTMQTANRDTKKIIVGSLYNLLNNPKEFEYQKAISSLSNENYNLAQDTFFLILAENNKNTTISNSEKWMIESLLSYLKSSLVILHTNNT